MIPSTLKSHQKSWLILTFLCCAAEIVVFMACPTMVDVIFGTMVNLSVAFLIGQVIFYGYKTAVYALRNNVKQTVISVLCILFVIILGIISFEDHDVSTIIGQCALLSQALMIPMVILSVFGIYVWKLDLWKLYLIIGTLAGLIFMLWIPIGGVPDEFTHVVTAYRVSDSMMGIQNVNGGLILRVDDIQQMELGLGISSYNDAASFEKYISLFSASLNNGSLELMGAISVPQTYCYILPAVGITLGRLLGLATYPLLMTGRLLNFALFMFLTTYALKKIPHGKLIMFILLLMPMTIQQGMSYSYDVLVMGTSMVITAFTVKLVSADDSLYLTRSEWFMLAACSAALIPAKQYAYFLISLMPWFVLIFKKHPLSTKAMQNLKRIFLTLLGLFCIVVIIWGLTGSKTYQYSLSIFRDGIQHSYSIGYFIAHPLAIFNVMKTTFEAFFGMYCRGFVGEDLGWLDLHIPHIIVIIYFAMLLIASIQRKEDSYVIPGKVKLLFTVVSLLTACFIFGGLLLYWSSVEQVYIQGVQGRYFIPIALLVCLQLGVNRFRISGKEDHLINTAVLVSVVFVCEFLAIRL